MANLNSVTLIGNLTRDPELSHSPKGTAICKIGIAINREWKDESGAKKEEVTFVDCDAFGRTGEAIAQYLKKGRPILVIGRLKTSTWDDKATGQKRSKLGVVLESFQFLDSKGSEGAPATSNAAPRPAVRPPTHDVPTGGQAAVKSNAGPEAEDDIPFNFLPRSLTQWEILGFHGNKMK